MKLLKLKSTVHISLTQSKTMSFYKSEMNAIRCSGNGACWTRDRSKCKWAIGRFSCDCFINGRASEMNGYCKPVICMFGCELLRCMACAQVHPLWNMPGNYGRMCKNCATDVNPQTEISSDPFDTFPGQEMKNVLVHAAAIGTCRICGTASDSSELTKSAISSAECERRHWRELNKVLPVTTDSHGGRHLEMHSLNTSDYTAYGKVAVLACYLKSDPPDNSIDRAFAHAISKVRIDLAEALRQDPAKCIAVAASMTNDISQLLKIMFSDCPGILMECLGHMMTITISAASDRPRT